MNQAQRVKKLEGKAGGDGRFFVLYESWAHDNKRWRVWPVDEVMTKEQFKARFSPSAEDAVLEIVYVDDWRPDRQGSKA